MTSQKIEEICTITALIVIIIAAVWAFLDFKKHQKRIESDYEKIKEVQKETFVRLETMAKDHYDIMKLYKTPRRFKVEIEQGMWFTGSQYGNIYWIHIRDLHKVDHPYLYSEEKIETTNS